MIQSVSASHAKKYFSDALTKSDYYVDKQELQGHFTGLLAERLKISGPADKATFFKLCENINPLTGKNLTPRTKEERTVGYDINFHVPKSVSIIQNLTADSHLLDAFEAAVTETLKDIEADSMTRVRKGDVNTDRHSGELIIARFTHQTARPVKNRAPDPHLHCHAYVFNCAYDPVEDKIKAGQFREIKRDMPYYQARFHKRLSDKLIDLGYGIRLTDKAWEIENVPQSVIDHFSKRSNEIGQFAKEHNITDPEALSELGARTRGKKQNNLTMQELKASWRKQIAENIPFDPTEMNGVIRHNSVIKEQKIFAKDCVEHTINHCFERASVIQDRRLLASGFKYSIGERHISIEDIETTTAADERLITVKQGRLNYCTTEGVLTEEREMVQLAKNGKGRFKPLYKEAPELKYDGQQGAAIANVLTTADQVSIIRGVAGAGKTTSLLELDRHIRAVGKESFVVTPMAKTAHEQMPMEGFSNAETGARLIIDAKLQERLKNQVLIVDEAGQLGTTDMKFLLHIAERQKCRLVLVGDTRQHNAVTRGDALRIISKVGQIPTAEVSKIYRQRSNPQYLSAVEDFSKGNIKGGFEKLDSMDAIRIIEDPLKPHRELVSDYMENIKKGKSTLIISPTHRQGVAITTEIRTALREIGRIDKKETTVRKLGNLNFTEAEKADWRRYKPGQIIRFNQNVPNIKRGSEWRLHDANSDKVSIKNSAGVIQVLPLERAKAFSVLQQDEIGIAKGDQLRITQGGNDLEGRRLNNGQAMEVIRVNKDGTLHLKNSVSNANYLISKEYGYIDYAYYSTSHSAQGKTVDTVLIAQPADTFSATDSKQFYVSCSRGKESIVIYTDDKEKLLEHASRLGDRQSAIELVDNLPSHEEHVTHLERSKHFTKDSKIPEKDRVMPSLNSNFEDYEPGL